MSRLYYFLDDYLLYYSSLVEMGMGDSVNYSREKLRPETILEGIVLTKEEFKESLTVTFFPKTGETVENFYDAGSSTS